MELISTTQLLRFLAALILVVGMMLGLSAILRRAQGGSLTRGGQKRRLRIVEMTALDHRRRLVLIRRDDREHLVILGPAGETVVETGIAPPAESEKADR